MATEGVDLPKYTETGSEGSLSKSPSFKLRIPTTENRTDDKKKYTVIRIRKLLLIERIFVIFSFFGDSRSDTTLLDVPNNCGNRWKGLDSAKAI